MAPRSIPERLRAGRRAVAGATGVRLIEDCVWHESLARWVLHCELMAEVANAGPIPPTTEWYIFVDNDYPWGDIAFYPSKRNGLEGTYHHQSHNDMGGDTQPWRTGKVCLDTTVRALGRQALDIEPFEPEQRLAWQIDRARLWLALASRGQLVLPGEPFELPHFPEATRAGTVASAEGPESYTAWQGVADPAGRLELTILHQAPPVFVVRRFLAARGETVYAPPWGRRLQSEDDGLTQGVWMRLPAAPVLPPWQAPTTWGELRNACGAQGVDIIGLLEPVARSLRDGMRHIAILGFPIPERAGDAPGQMHWQALMLPALSWANKTSRGFRPNETGYWQRDRKVVLVDDMPLEWLASENWAVNELSRRGQFSPDLSQGQALILGAGAMGSAIAELLLRGGVTTLVVMDSDIMHGANLVRHALSLDDIGAPKAEALARHLNARSPQGSVLGLDTTFPPEDPQHRAQILKCRLVVDCTANDQVLHSMETFDWRTPRLFLSVWLGPGAKRVYCCSAYGTRFPHEVLRVLISRWLREEMESYGEELPREGTGCWHPVFPARADDIWGMASVAVKHLLGIATSPPSRPQLAVYEQGGGAGPGPGITRIALEHA